MSTILWFRKDLRLDDNPALARAIERGQPIIPVFLWAPEEEGTWRPGAASNWWLHCALHDLAAQLERVGSRLIVRRAGAEGTLGALIELAHETKAEAIFWNRRYDPAIVARDKKIKSALPGEGIEAWSGNAGMLAEPHEIKNKSSEPFRVFTPMWKHYRTREIDRPVLIDRAEWKSPHSWPTSLDIDFLDLMPKIPWDGGFNQFWGPTREAILCRLRHFLAHKAEAYSEGRDSPFDDATTRLSPFLHFGQIGPREVLWMFRDSPHYNEVIENGILRQLFWREFGHHLLFHFPQTTDEPLVEKFRDFPWNLDEAKLKKWQRGETGYPMVDAGMRQLWETGWMHNRARMIVASFLVKHLLQPWQEGARWFWDTLVDADLANNTLGWQWTAGCGADAAPYFRIFNPFTQGEKFDPSGEYVRRFVPELAKLPKKFIHRPWEAPPAILSHAGVILGKNYPLPMVSHSDAREAALAAFQQLKK